MKKYQLSVEVIIVSPSLYESLNIKIISRKKSVNGFIDLVIEGTEDNLLSFLKIHHGEDADYFKEYKKEV